MKRAALIAGISAVTLACALSGVQAAPGQGSWWGSLGTAEPSPNPAPQKSIRPRPKPTEHADAKNEKAQRLPSGLLHIIVSIDKQRATLFADGAPFASTPISTGTASHPTPMGLFTVIQKDRHHVSNLYDAAMPYMQRITWSGSALHQGPLPGYPASHGCVRLPEAFAQLLWKATKMGARVVITRPDVAPLEFDHKSLFTTRPKMVEAPRPPTPPLKVASADPVTTASVAQAKVVETATIPLPIRIKTSDAPVVAITATVGDASKAVVTSVETEPAANTADAEQPTKASDTDGISAQTPEATDEVKSAETQESAAQPVEAATIEAAPVEAQPVAAEAKPEAKPVATMAAPTPIIVDERPKTMPAAIVREANRRPISVFASLKEGKLYVRQGWKPLFDAPVSFVDPQQPIGTHLYTAMGMKADGIGMRWTVVTIPSSTKRVAELKEQGRKPRNEHAPKAVEADAPLPSPGGALDRIVMTPELVERISELMTPGSSLIVSDNKLSDETGEYTDFVVVTR